jgi:hypothetical protein
MDGTLPTPINISLPTDTDTLHLSLVINGCLKTWNIMTSRLFLLIIGKANFNLSVLRYSRLNGPPLNSFITKTFLLLVLRKGKYLIPQYQVYDTPAVRSDFEGEYEWDICDIIPCTDFIICPSTLMEPNTYLHGYWHNKQCVLFFEKV